MRLLCSKITTIIRAGLLPSQAHSACAHTPAHQSVYMLRWQHIHHIQSVRRAPTHISSNARLHQSIRIYVATATYSLHPESASGFRIHQCKQYTPAMPTISNHSGSTVGLATYIPSMCIALTTWHFAHPRVQGYKGTLLYFVLYLVPCNPRMHASSSGEFWFL